MRLHVLVGAQRLLYPNLVGAEITQEIIGGRSRVASAFWLSPRCGKYYHDFLLDEPEDQRVAVFSASLVQDFGKRCEPLLILPDLVNAAQPSFLPTKDRRHPLEVLAAISAYLTPSELILHAAGLPSRLDRERVWTEGLDICIPDVAQALEALRMACERLGVEADRVSARALEVAPGQPGFEPLYRNAVAHALADRLQAKAEAEGFTVDIERALVATRETFDAWGRTGLFLSRMLDSAQLESLTQKAFAVLLGEGQMSVLQSPRKTSGA